MSNTTATLKAATRDRHGKGAARELRRQGQVPAVIYGTKHEPQGLALSFNDLTLEYRKGRFSNRLINLDLDGKTIRVLPKEVQTHPVTDKIEHVDFFKIEKGVHVRVGIPVKFKGQEKSPGIKRGGVLNVVRHEIEFDCDPDLIPTHIEVNIADMEIGDSVHINDVKLPEGIKATIKRNFTVATVAGRMAAEEEVAPVAAAAAAGAEGAAAAPGAPAAPGTPAAAGTPAAGAAPAAAGKKDEGKKDKK